MVKQGEYVAFALARRDSGLELSTEMSIVVELAERVAALEAVSSAQVLTDLMQEVADLKGEQQSLKDAVELLIKKLVDAGVIKDG